MSLHNLSVGGNGKSFSDVKANDIECNNLSVANMMNVTDINVLGNITGIALNNLDDVSYIAGPNNGEVLTYDSLFQEWQNKPAAGGGLLEFDFVESDALSPPSSVGLDLDKELTICNNNGTGFGGTWTVKLPDGVEKGQEKKLSFPLSGVTNTISNNILGTFSKGYTNCTLSGSNQPGFANFVWDGSVWIIIGESAVTFS